jgi:hypothetical protein
VEEELRKEQTEMHKLLKAKQDLIDIQKKRIEHLTMNRGTNSSSNQATKSISSMTTLDMNNSNNEKQVAASPSSSSSSMSQFCKYMASANNLVKSMPATAADMSVIVSPASIYNPSLNELNKMAKVNTVDAISSTSSSSSALSTSSSMNHLSQNNQTNFNFFRTSEL